MVLAVRSWTFRLLLVGLVAVLATVGLGVFSPSRARASTYTDEVTVVMAIPSGGTQDSTTLQQVVDMVNGPVADYWSSQSGGSITIGVTGQVDWFQSSATCGDLSNLWFQAARQAGWTRGAGKHLLVYAPPTVSGCNSIQADAGPSSGNEMYVPKATTSMIAQALAENFGLSASQGMKCDGVVDAYNAGLCQWSFKDDYYDVMGPPWEQLGSLNVVQAAKLGLLPSGQVQTISPTDAPVTVTIDPVSGTTGTRAIHLLADNSYDYWLEYRPASGQDAWLGTAANTKGLDAGVLLRQAAGPGWSQLLDGSPSPRAGWAADTHLALPIGAPVKFAYGVYTVTVTAEGANATVSVVPETPISVAHDAYGGDTGTLGAATSSETCGSYCVRTYEHGNIYWSSSTGSLAHVVQGDILGGYLAVQGADGALGLPLGDQVCGLPGGGCDQKFANGAIYTSPVSGVHAVDNAYDANLFSQGGVEGWVGYPTSDRVCGLVGGGCKQFFQHAALVSSTPNTYGAWVSGGMLDAWNAAGAENGWMGYPIWNTLCGINSPVCTQNFQVGTVYWTAAAGAHAVIEPMLTGVNAAGADGNGLGYPTSDEVCGLARGGCYQQFLAGVEYWSPASGAHAMTGWLKDPWAAAGSENGWLGYPTSDPICGLRGGGCLQIFQTGVEYWSQSSGTHAVNGALRATWAGTGSENGWLAYPTTDAICGLRAGGCLQIFQGGVEYWSPASGTHPVNGGLRSAWAAMGSENGWLGYPTSDAVCGLIRGGCLQAFQTGVEYWSPASGTHAVNGAIRAAWGLSGSQNGWLGYPVSDASCDRTGCMQAFQGARLFWSSATGRVVPR